MTEVSDKKQKNQFFTIYTKDWNRQTTLDNMLMVFWYWAHEDANGKITRNVCLRLDANHVVIPDFLWVSNQRFHKVYQHEDGFLYGVPELVAEVLSENNINEIRDCVNKLQLYSKFGASEYWIVDWQARQIEIYRRKADNPVLQLVETLSENDFLTSPLLLGFSCRVSQFFEDFL